MFRLFCRNMLITVVCLSVSGLSLPLTANAGFIGTDDYLAIEDRQVRIERIQDTLMQDRVSRQLTALGVNPEHAQQRVAALTDADLIALDERLQDLPAGGGALELVLVFLFVFLILDLMGVTDLFPTIGPSTG